MITKKQIKSAIDLLNDKKNWYKCRPLTQSLCRSLVIYKNRNEFDGTISSAVECLSLAGYEIRGES
jgi:hypothetical protein